MTREEAWNIVCEFVQSDSLRRHMLGVEACVTKYAQRFGEDPELWSVTALLHDFDWEIHPNMEQHPHHGSPILRERGVSERVIHAILTHADYLGIPRVDPMEKVLFAVDELCGLVTAATLVRPTRSIYDLDISSVKKKFKDKAFARQVNREDITQGAADLGVSMDEHIGLVIEAMRGIARTLGLDGQAA